MAGYFQIEHRKDGAAFLSMTRPEVNNAFDDAMIIALTDALESLNSNDAVHSIVLSGEGKNFCAGANIEWMRRAASYGFEDNKADAQNLAKLMSTLYQSRKTTIARVQGAVYGGGVGLVACCDIVFASNDARFCLSEVKLGLIPSVISPYVVSAMGARACKRYFQTAEVFDAQRALALGLIHDVTDPEKLDQCVGDVLLALYRNAPDAKPSAKRLAEQVSGRAIDAEVIAATADLIAVTRMGDEAKEGLSAFLEKRNPTWLKQHG